MKPHAVLALLVAAVFSGCSDPISPQPIIIREAYELISVDGQPLPFLLTSDSRGTEHVEDGGALIADGIISFTGSIYHDWPGQSAGSNVMTWLDRVTVSDLRRAGSTILFTVGGAWQGTIRGDTLTLRVQNTAGESRTFTLVGCGSMICAN
ncbi:MAG TPA: hypothetical protein VGD49_04085 [Longimicrobiales bacterium]